MFRFKPRNGRWVCLMLMLMCGTLGLAACGNSDSLADVLTPAAVPTLAPTLTPVPATPFPNYSATLFGATNLNTELLGGGSSRINSVALKWIPLYNQIASGVKIKYESTNSGTGQSAFLGTPVPQGSYTFVPSNALNFVGSDNTYNSTQLKAVSDNNKGELVHIPVIIGGVAVIYRLDGYKGEVHLSGPTLTKIFMGQIKNWNEADITADNAGVALPSKPINVVIRSRDSSGSGTTELFTRFLASINNDFRDKIGVGTKVDWPQFGQLEGPGSGQVADIVKGRDGAIGYVDQEVAIEKSIDYASIRNQTGRYVKPTRESLTAAAQGTSVPDDFRTFIINPQGAAAYPIAGFSWIIVWKDMSKMPNPSPEKAQALANFLWWGIHDGQKLENLPTSFAPLPIALTQRLEGLFVNTDSSKVFKYNNQPVLTRNT